jgi:predicted nucleic acid-binding protein
MIDTSALVAALVSDHEHHALARGHLCADTVIPAIVLAETYAQFRRTFGQPAAAAAYLLQPWTADPRRIAVTTAAVVTSVFGRAAELDLGGNIHDALIAATCAANGLGLVALALGVTSTLLLPTG